MSKHTPGPWRVVIGERNIGGDLVSVVSADGTEICDNETYYPTALDPRNANLIAAAPDLLEALESARTYVEWAYECAFPDAEKNTEILASIDAAIARAKGESQ